MPGAVSIPVGHRHRTGTGQWPAGLFCAATARTAGATADLHLYASMKIVVQSLLARRYAGNGQHRPRC